MYNRKKSVKARKPTKAPDLTPLYGLLKTKESGQHFKDMVREGWEPKRREPQK